MVTKFEGNLAASVSRSVLAKIFMVTKHVNVCTFGIFCSSKNSYGNKTSKIW